MKDYGQALHDGIGAGLGVALLTMDASLRARREAQRWSRAEAATEQRVVELGERLLAAQRRERDLLARIARIARLEAEAQAQRLRANVAEGRVRGALRRGAA